MPLPVIKQSSMSKQPAMQEKALEVAHAAIEECNTEKDIAHYIKEKFEKEYGHM